MDDDERCTHWTPPRSAFFSRPLPGRCRECAAEEYAAWEASVRARFQEALLHITLGLDATWDRLPCLRYPECVGGPSPWLPNVTYSRI